MSRLAKMAGAAVATLLLAAAAPADTRVVIGGGIGEANSGVADEFRFALVAVEVDLLIPRLDAWLTFTAGSGEGDFGDTELTTFALGIDWQPFRRDWFEVGAGYRRASALLVDLDLGVEGLNAIGTSEQWLTRISLDWEDAALGLTLQHLWTSPRPERATGNDLCLRWAFIQGCGSWINRPAPLPDGEAWTLFFLYVVGETIEWPWKR